LADFFYSKTTAAPDKGRGYPIYRDSAEVTKLQEKLQQQCSSQQQKCPLQVHYSYKNRYRYASQRANNISYWIIYTTAEGRTLSAFAIASENFRKLWLFQIWTNEN
jgi:hypothetical protein